MPQHGLWAPAQPVYSYHNQGLSKQVKSNPGPGNYNLSGKNTNIGCKYSTIYK